ncbi:thioesterase II family protein [Streptomyces kebangsaanensis]|uniref:thioesterase II family protein n=1 Tax=Streptomyces kebangsaanensis TaxID=864058 RepID=UPI00093A960C|nr:thioesterase domain-containing protein [Streptomyces kebangsaanensis]
MTTLVPAPGVPAPPVFTAESPWVRRAARPGRPRLRLLCFPYAGTGASLYRSWPAMLPEDIEIVAVQPPGREDRARDALPSGVGPLARACALALRPYTTVPYAVYGHCAGAVLGAETARELVRRGAEPPRLLIAAGHRAPHLPARAQPLHTLPDEAFLDGVRALGGIPERLLGNAAFMEFLLPLLRADFALWETHQGDPGAALLPFPVLPVRGDADTVVTEADAAAWREHTTAPPRDVAHVPGGHYFVNDMTPQAVAVLISALETARPLAPTELEEAS